MASSMNLAISISILKCKGSGNSLVVFSKSECLNPIEVLLSESSRPGEVSRPDPLPRFFWSLEITFKVDSERRGLVCSFRRVSFRVIFLVLEAVGVGTNLGVPDVSWLKGIESSSIRFGLLDFLSRGFFEFASAC